MNSSQLFQPLPVKLIQKNLIKLIKVHDPSAQESGFTLIELLVVIIIIGILAAIALPSFLNQAAKAKQTEAKTYVGAVMRAQQAHRMENTQFAATIPELQLGVPTQTTDYIYSLASASSLATEFRAITTDSSTLRSYASLVIVRQGLTSAIACQTKLPSNATPNIQNAGNSPIRCQGNSEEMR